MVFCTYCGQSFKRKEHLERHIPQHTNVKPFKCDSCQLSFARRDLLQKHHWTYHEVHANQQGSNGDPPVSQRTPIACSNCATAKAGCDKKLPCSRCSDKNLTCAPRFARRSPKAYIRSTTAPKLSNMKEPLPPLLYQSGQTNGGSESDIDMNMDGKISSKRTHNDSDLLFWDSPQGGCTDPSQSLRFSPSTFESLGNVFGGSSEISASSDFDPKAVELNSMNMWNNYPMDLDPCGGSNLNYSPQNAMFWFPDALELTVANGIPSPPSTTSPSHSRINSNSPRWQPPNSVSKETNAGIAPPSLDSSEIPELELIIATEEAWPLARCNSRLFSGSCPRTAITHLQTLQNCSKLEGAWMSMNDMMSPGEQNWGDGSFSIVPLQPTTRDKIIAFAQSFLLKALMTHQGGTGGQTTGSAPGAAAFFTLPPSNVLENLLGSSVKSLNPYFSLIHGTTLDPNELMLDNDASTLLFLLMMAQGASTVPKAEARYLAAGLTETCRISLFDVIEKNIELSADPIVLKAAFLFVLLAAWGGDPWHIKQAMGQRGMYLAMLKHSGRLEPQASVTSDIIESPDKNWKEWLEREHIYRLVYNWTMLDQELSLFHDTSPILSITDLQTPLPSNERLWRAKNSTEWLHIRQETYTSSGNMEYHSPAFPHENLSLSHLFQNMLRDEPEVRSRQLSAPLLKLLLHPLQTLVYHLGQLLSCFYGLHDKQQGTRPHTTASTLLRLEEVQSSLHKWYDLAMLNNRQNSECSITNGSLVLYHVIYLNTVTYFPEIERVARREESNGHSWESSLRAKHFIYHSDKAVFHALEVFRLVSSMPKSGRPPWWSAALYRATMILWADCASSSYYGDSHEKDQAHILKSETSNGLAIRAYLSDKYLVPSLQRRDADCVNSELPEEVLLHCISLLDCSISSRFSDGIRRKLQTILKNWKGV